MAGYLIGETLRLRLRETIDRVREMPEGEKPTRIETRFEDIPRPSSAQLRYVSWPADWKATQTATITFLPGTAQTATAINVFAGVGPGEGWVARHNGTWHLAVVNLTMQPSYVADDIQLLGHGGNGILRWYSVTQCGTATAS